MSTTVSEHSVGVRGGGDAGDGGVRVVVARSAYNGWVTDRLLEGAIEAMGRLAPGGAVEVATVSGSLELPQVVEAALATGRFDAAVALGCVIRGETVHDRIIGEAIIGSLVEIAVRRARPVGIGVLTVENAEQAESRAGGAHGNKGAESMEAALQSLGVCRSLASGEGVKR